MESPPGPSLLPCLAPFAGVLHAQVCPCWFRFGSRAPLACERTIQLLPARFARRRSSVRLVGPVVHNRLRVRPPPRPLLLREAEVKILA